jgi:hypothetical protein
MPQSSKVAKPVALREGSVMFVQARHRAPVWITIALVATIAGAVLPASAAALPTGGSGAGAVAGAATTSAARKRPSASVALPPTCVTVGGPGAADDLMHNRYTFPPHPTVTLPSTLTWTEDPLHDNNWRYNLHSMSWVLALAFAWRATGKRAYLRRALVLVKSWVTNNPRSNPPSNMSWNDMSTAIRAITFSCLARMLPTKTAWLQDAINLHGVTLADPHFYDYSSNHALNQNIGLLEAGCWLNRPYWMQLAENRISILLPQSVDTQGASNERSVSYEYYNFKRYNLARRRLEACGQSVSASFVRLNKMPLFLALATMPNGRYVTIGDGQNARAFDIPGTPAEFAATQGAAGPKPSTTFGVYNAGWVFGRTGWGETRPFADETMFSIRFGPSQTIHGHDDGGSVTLYGDGKALLVDPGIKDYNLDQWRTFFESRAAHNVLNLEGVSERSNWTTTLTRSKISKRAYDGSLSIGAYSGVTLNRRVVFSRRLGFMVVDDTMSSSRSERARQLWHVPIGRGVKSSGADTWTRGAGGDVLVRQLIATGTTQVIKGQTSPLQGWLPNGWGKVASAPVIVQAASGQSLRFITLLVPFTTKVPDVTIKHLTTGPNSFSFTITMGKSSQKVVATATSVTITDLK